ncbi:MAG: hypothetical protein IKH11_02535 [Bacteroidales bacterium]|nr:hypothetical protein [Bacteroidales bacterium]
MKFSFPAIAAAVLCCLSCVEIDPGLGGSLIPTDQTYTIHPTEAALPYGAVLQQPADSLSGFSQTRITLGAVRDNKFGLTTRSCALTLVPAADTLDFGNLAAAKIVNFHFAAAHDTVSVPDQSQKHILQNVNVYSLAEPMRPGRDYNCNGNTLKVDYSKPIVNGNPVINGTDSLSFDFTEEYARRFLSITQEDLGDFGKYSKKIPGIHLSTDAPLNEGGRINIFELQVGYDSEVQYVLGNYAKLSLKCDYDYDGVAEKDTTFFFAFGLTDFVKLDSLFTDSNTKRGSYPEYCLNLTGHESRSMAGPAGETIAIEGGGGLKPLVSAVELKHLAESMILEQGGEPTGAVINKASLIFPFRFPDNYLDMERYPYMLSPTCRIRQNDTTVVFAVLTDASSADENQGIVNRSTLRYEPDITYHLQELLKIHETPVSGESDIDIMKRRKLLGGEYDIWLIINAHEVTKTSSESDSSLSDYYQMLMYQQYYNNMYYGGYGGYGYGYGGYGYGGYGGYGYDPYSNYYNYYLMASMYGNSGTTESAQDVLDKDRYYCAELYGPKYPDASLRPVFKLTFSIPKKEQ